MRHGAKPSAADCVEPSSAAKIRSAEVDDGRAPGRVATAVDREGQHGRIVDDLRRGDGEHGQQVVARRVGRGERRAELAVEAQGCVEERGGRAAMLGEQLELVRAERRGERDVEPDEQRRTAPTDATTVRCAAIGSCATFASPNGSALPPRRAEPPITNSSATLARELGMLRLRRYRRW